MTRTYPLNAWYAVSWEKDLGQSPVARTVCDLPIVLYRKSDNTPVALQNACLHRLLPLSLGRVDGDEIVCGYHGMAFGSDGRCVRMPQPKDKPSPNARIRNYPIEQRHGLIWLWPGDAEAADPDLVPDMHWAVDPAWATEGADLDMACDYRLLIDNLLDLTHETFVHSSSIGHKGLVEVDFEVSHQGREVQLRRWMIDTDAPPFLAMQLQRARGLPPEHVDRWQIINFTAPATVVIDVGVAKTGTGAPEGDRTQGVSGVVLNTITPQSEGRCYYFFAFVRSFALDDEALTVDMKAGVTSIFFEDKVILEEQQRMIETLPNNRLLNIGIDQASVRARRAISRMIASEAPAAAEEVQA